MSVRLWHVTKVTPDRIQWLIPEALGKSDIYFLDIAQLRQPISFRIQGNNPKWNYFLQYTIELGYRLNHYTGPNASIYKKNYRSHLESMEQFNQMQTLKPNMDKLCTQMHTNLWALWHILLGRLNFSLVYNNFITWHESNTTETVWLVEHYLFWAFMY